MSLNKKKFTDGLESLFTAQEEEGRQGTAFLEGSAITEKAGNRTAGKKTSSRKDFTTDLDSLFEQTMQESFAEQMRTPQKGFSSEGTSATKTQVFHQQTHRRRPVSGLDMLIRRTVERSTIEEDETTGVRRLTVAFDKEKLNKLKAIARLEKAYLKDILSEIVAEYIQKYEQSKGGIKTV